ncbi:hypothetical protein LSH36_1634g00007 [Paralvinella palmiformis]|uniref:Uncharacterized protein n=1 Tax=Paralvinella palmiformis TaxID=53620 RepID=A0AAD9MND8_9ANNE|nr:hypothetical protein LSH36_1634g00007 [Paralvinella palmiformis]
MLMRQTRAMSRRQSQTTVSQLDGIDDRQNEQTKTKQKNKTKNPPPRTGQGHIIPGQVNLIREQGSKSDHMVSRIGMTPKQVGAIPGQLDKISGQTT